MDGSNAPLWGALAVEQYLINNWDASSTETPAQQRQRLIYGYLDLQEVPIEWLEDPACLLEGTPPRRTPTTNEIDVILRPYRNDALRRRASQIHEHHYKDFPVFLRTHYSVEEDKRTKEDELMDQWASSGEFEYEAWWASLNDATQFDFGSEWRRVFEILPEIAGPGSGGSLTERTLKRALDLEDNDLVELRVWFKEALHREKQRDPYRWRENREAVIEEAATSMQHVITEIYMIIADEEAFRSGRLLVVFLDGFRNIIRQARFDTDEYDVDYIVSGFTETNEFAVDTTVGEKYRVEGELGKQLYQLNSEDLADPN
ncbi:uncharacterized protein N7477_008541 [Penicillium maclennaniae]|uniref:uncharacterized protein n=1 Tax=Penicillium maclennaniae TaxID=1343394 RepID=UPI00253F897F|nr:uncharacterized protein N7477_008541 [Penicillium maclennaniae]KAJ5666093.1 hypothetical protein N7477_008541 [Penicillium maclennaniae]